MSPILLSELENGAFVSERMNLLKDEKRLEKMEKSFLELCVLDGDERIYSALKEIM